MVHRPALVSHMAFLYDGMGSDVHMPDDVAQCYQVRTRGKCHDR
jgi:hypothetical protein